MKQVGDVITIGISEGARTPFAYPMIPYTVKVIRQVTGTILSIKQPPGYSLTFELANPVINDNNNIDILCGTKGGIKLHPYNPAIYLVNIASDQRTFT